MIVAQALRMSPRPVLGGAAPVAPDAPAPHVLRARVVDRQSPRHAPGVVPEAWREEAGGWWYAEDSNHHDDHDDR